MFQAVSPPIIRSTKLYIQRQVLSNQYCCLLLQYWFVFVNTRYNIRIPTSFKVKVIFIEYRLHWELNILQITRNNFVTNCPPMNVYVKWTLRFSSICVWFMTLNSPLSFFPLYLMNLYVDQIHSSVWRYFCIFILI